MVNYVLAVIIIEIDIFHWLFCAIYGCWPGLYECINVKNELGTSGSRDKDLSRICDPLLEPFVQPGTHQLYESIKLNFAPREIQICELRVVYLGPLALKTAAYLSCMAWLCSFESLLYSLLLWITSNNRSYTSHVFLAWLQIRQVRLFT